MKPISKTKVVVITAFSFFATFAIWAFATKNTKQKQKEQEKIAYNKTNQEDYNPEYDKTHPVVATIPTRYLNKDSVRLRVQYIEGCRWVGRINGTSADKEYHTIANCPNCKKFFISLSKE